MPLYKKDATTLLEVMGKLAAAAACCCNGEDCGNCSGCTPASLTVTPDLTFDTAGSCPGLPFTFAPACDPGGGNISSYEHKGPTTVNPGTVTVFQCPDIGGVCDCWYYGEGPGTATLDIWHSGDDCDTDDPTETVTYNQRTLVGIQANKSMVVVLGFYQDSVTCPPVPDWIATAVADGKFDLSAGAGDGDCSDIDVDLTLTGGTGFIDDDACSDCDTEPWTEVDDDAESGDINVSGSCTDA